MKTLLQSKIDIQTTMHHFFVELPRFLKIHRMFFNTKQRLESMHRFLNNEWAFKGGLIRQKIMQQFRLMITCSLFL